MIWLIVIILIGVISYLFFKKRKFVTLNNEEAMIVGGLIDKEKKVLADQLHDMADNAALQGTTMTVDSFLKVTPDMSEELKVGIEKIKQDLIDKYGAVIPANTMHRISWEMDGNGKMWNDHPGCFERHLQRRDGNPLFSSKRRIILRKEIEDAVEMDYTEAELFRIRYKSFAQKQLVLFRNKKEIDITQVQVLLQEVVQLLEEGAAIGESIDEQRGALEGIEDTLINSMNQVVPAGADLLRQFRSMSMMKRQDYSAQYGRSDSPIHREEFLATLLSEDDSYITSAAITCKSFGLDDLSDDDESRNMPDKLPNTKDVQLLLDTAKKQGFSQARADRIMDAWNEGLDYRLEG